MFGKGEKYSFRGDGNLDCQFLTTCDGNNYVCGLVNHALKVVSPVHGYYYPNSTAMSLMRYALKLGYVYEDEGMPAKVNKTKKRVIKFRGIDYVSTFADLVFCPNCNVMEVVPIGACVCPKCGENVVWAEDDVYEVELASLNAKYNVIEDDAKLTNEDLFND